MLVIYTSLWKRRAKDSFSLPISGFNERVHLIPGIYDPIFGYVYRFQRVGLDVSNIKIYGLNIYCTKWL
jgi:hypothetical protein